MPIVGMFWFDIHSLIQSSSDVLRTYGGGVIKLMGQIELVCEFHTLQFQPLNKDVMDSEPPVLGGSECVGLGLIEIGGNTCSFDRNNPKSGALEVPTWLGTAERKSEGKWNSWSGIQARLTEW